MTGRMDFERSAAVETRQVFQRRNPKNLTPSDSLIWARSDKILAYPFLWAFLFWLCCDEFFDSVAHKSAGFAVSRLARKSPRALVWDRGYTYWPF